MVGRLARARASDFEWSWKRQLDPASEGPVRRLPLRHQERRGLQQEADHRRQGRSACGPRTTGRSRSRWRGRAATSRSWPPTWPRSRPTEASVEKHGDKWTEAAQHRLQRPVHARGVGAQQADGAPEEPALLRRQGRAPSRRSSSRSSRSQPGALPYENNELDITLLQTGDLKRLRGDPRTGKDVFRYPVPGYLVPAPAGDEAALRQPQGPQGGGPRHRPGERGQGQPGPRRPRVVHDPAGLPRARSTTRRSRPSSATTRSSRWSSSRARPSRAARTGRRSR